MAIAAAAAGMSRSIRDLLAEREERRLQAALETRQQQQLQLQQAQEARLSAAQDANIEDRALQRRTEGAGVMASLLGPGAELTPEQAGTFTGTPFAPLVEEKSELESFTMDPSSGQRQTAPGGRKYLTLKPTRQQEQEAGQREGRRTLTTLIRRGAPRGQVLSAMADAGQDISAAMLNDPDAAQRRAIELERVRGDEDRRTAGARTGSASAADQVWVIRGGTPIPIQKGTAQPGDQPYDPVAARNTGVDDPQAEAMDTAREVQRISRNLRTHKGLPGVFGVVSSRLPTLRQSTADAQTLLNSLQGLLTLENMGKMKGVLSDADMRIVRQASTTLDTPMSEPAARAELFRLEQVMSKLTGDLIDDSSSQDGEAGAGRAAGAGPRGAIRYDMNGNPISQ